MQIVVHRFKQDFVSPCWEMQNPLVAVVFTFLFRGYIYIQTHCRKAEKHWKICSGDDILPFYSTDHLGTNWERKLGNQEGGETPPRATPAHRSLANAAHTWRQLMQSWIYNGQWEMLRWGVLFLALSSVSRRESLMMVSCPLYSSNLHVFHPASKMLCRF